MDDDLPVPLEGRRVRVFASLIQQAHDQLSMRGSEYVTFLVVGAQAVSIYTGRPQRRVITHEVQEEEQSTTQMRGGRAAQKKQKKAAAHPKGKTRARSDGLPRGAIDIDGLQLLDFFHRERNRELSARAIGDEIGLPRGNLPMRATLSRLIAELRVSGLVRATDDGRVPDYQFVTQLPDLSVPKTITPETILAFMRDLKRPLALGIIGDMLNIGRQDRSNRFHLSLILGQLTKNKQLTVNTEERMKIPVYQVA